MIQDIRRAWGDVWPSAGFRRSLWFALGSAVPLAYFLPRFFAYIQTKPGALLNDPVLASIGPMDLAVPIFSVLYSVIVLSVLFALRDPHRLVRAMHAYVLMTLIRFVTISLFTLEAPLDIIPLIDPITQNFYPGADPFLKDLFFSGHTATLFILTLMLRSGWMKIVALVATVAVAFMLLLQHVHWTVDVAAAPFFTWMAWRLAAVTARITSGGA